MVRLPRRLRSITGLVFTDVHVRHILAGTKTATRRLVHPPPVWHERLQQWFWNPLGDHGPLQYLCVWNTDMLPDPYALRYCPYGQVGSTLVIREAFQARRRDTLTYWTNHHPHDRALIPYSMWEVRYRATDPPWEHQPGWQSNRFMPYSFARITVRITGLAMRRVQAMTDADAWAEGIGDGDDSRSAVDRYAEVWNRLHQAPNATWHDNPWVWVIHFVRVTDERRSDEPTGEADENEPLWSGDRVV